MARIFKGKTGSGAGAPSGQKAAKRRKPPEIKGDVIYRDSRATPPKKGAPLRFENVEWLSLRDEIGRGFAGIVSWAKLKVKGNPQPKRAVVKEYLDPAEFLRVNEAVNRLRGSDVSCPKMDSTYAKRRLLIIMEPFIRSVETEKGERKMVSKFFDAGKNLDLVGGLDLGKAKDREIFRGVAKELGKLAKIGLWVAPAEDPYRGELRMDAFNAVALRNGKAKVFVQDLDTVHVSDAVSIKNWMASVHNLMLVVGQKEKNVGVASEILRKTEGELFGE